MKLTRRDALKASGLALGGLAIGGADKGLAQCLAHGPCYPTNNNTQRYSWYDKLPTMDFTQTPVAPGTPFTFSTPSDTPKLDPNEMRITFMGSCTPLLRRAQALMSIFVEVGWQNNNNKAVDQVIFDCGSGCTRNYSAMGVGYGRMDKIFINHLHGDHSADLSHIYCFGPSGDRLSPQFVFGPSASGVRSPRPPRRYYDDGINAFCANLREAWRWHTESFSFQNTSYEGYQLPTQQDWGLPVKPVPVSDDPPNDGYAMIPIQLDWTQIGGVAYNNPNTHLKITHFPVIHTRRGAMGYKLEWYGPDGSWNRPLSMIYTSDTKPEQNTILQAMNRDPKGVAKGVDVLIHEMIVPPEIWAMEFSHLNEPGSGPNWDNTVARSTDVQNASHTSQGAFGYLLSQINPRPRLTVATHFPVSDDTIACALESVRKHCPDITDLGQGLTWSFDLLVLRVYPDRIEQYRANVLEYGFGPLYAGPAPNLKNPPKYSDPTAQIDTTYAIDPGNDTYCSDGY